MDHVDAQCTIQLLADGTDPVTGLPLPDSSPYNHPLVLRSLFAAVRALEISAGTIRLPTGLDSPHPLTSQSTTTGNAAIPPIEPAAKRGTPTNAGKPWNPVEDEALCSAFEQGLDIKALAAKHGRSRTAVNARLFKLGKIADPGIPLRQRVPATKLKRGAATSAP